MTDIQKLFIKKSILCGGYFILAILTEMFTFLWLGMGLFPKYFMLDLAVIFILTFILFILPHTTAELVVASILLALQIFISILNKSLYDMSNMVFGFTMFNLINETTGAFDSGFVNWWMFGLYFGTWLLALAGGIVLQVKYKIPKKTYTRNAIIITLISTILASGIMSLAYGLTVKSFTTYADSEEDLSFFCDESEIYTTQRFPAKTYKMVGTFAYLMINFHNFVTHNANEAPLTNDEITNYLNQGEMSETAYDGLYTGSIQGKNVVLIVIESGEWYAINQEYTPTLYAMATQGIRMLNYEARDKTNHSEAISILGSYPLDSSIDFAQYLGTSLDYTLPNIMQNSGYTTNYFHANVGNFYQRNKTFTNLYGFNNANFLDTMPWMDGYTNKAGFSDLDKDSEMMANYGAITKQNEGDDAFYTQIMSLTTHGSYYDLTAYGNYPFATTPCKKGEVSTGEMTQAQKTKFSKKARVKYMEDYYAIIDRFPSGYVPDTTGVDEDNLERLGNYADMFLRYKRFQAGMMDLDYGVNQLVNELQNDNKLEDTLFFFYADHSAYYGKQNYILKGIAEDVNPDVYNIPCFMWYGGTMNLNNDQLPLDNYVKFNYTAPQTSSHFTSKAITKFCNTYDIVPTLLDLLGINFNTNLYHGVSMLEDPESVFISHEAGAFNKDIYFSFIDLYQRTDGVWQKYDFDSNYTKGTFDDNTNVTDFLAGVHQFYVKQKVLDSIVKHDYFATHSIGEWIKSI